MRVLWHLRRKAIYRGPRESVLAESASSSSERTHTTLHIFPYTCKDKQEYNDSEAGVATRPISVDS